MPKHSHPTWKGAFVLAPQAGVRAQRAYVQVRYVDPQARGMRSMVTRTALALYYMRKGDHEHGQFPLYERQGQDVDLPAFAARTRQDPHQWHLEISPERGDDVDLTTLAKRTMAQMEQDTGYRLDWVAANHYDTAHPHTHILVRGLDQGGQIVGLKRDYMTHGLRYRVQDLLTQELGPRPLTLEQAQGLERSGLQQDRGYDRVPSLGRLFPREAPVGAGLRARLDPDHERGR